MKVSYRRICPLKLVPALKSEQPENNSCNHLLEACCETRQVQQV